jgi:hypothetical protein
MRAWGAGVSLGHVVLGTVAWAVLGVPGAPLFFGLCAALSLGLALIAAPLLRPRRDDGEDGPGTGGPGGDEPPPPPWWPDFEREFREYAQRKPPVGA